MEQLTDPARPFGLHERMKSRWTGRRILADFVHHETRDDGPNNISVWVFHTMGRSFVHITVVRRTLERVQDQERVDPSRKTEQKRELVRLDRWGCRHGTW